MRRLLLAAAASGLCAGAAQAQDFDEAVLAELNRVRADPGVMAAELMRDRPAERRSDPHAVAEAIAFLSRQAPMPPLKDDHRLTEAALDHVKAQGPTGAVGHGAPGDMSRRIKARDLWPGLAGESISYGQQTPRDVVRQLIIDADVPGRGHRELLFSANYQIAGVACGAHAEWGSMCVIDLVGDWKPPEQRQRPPMADPAPVVQLAKAELPLSDRLDRLHAADGVLNEPAGEVAHAGGISVAAFSDVVGEVSGLDHSRGQRGDVVVSEFARLGL